jgi:hypothetical protein
MILAAFVMGCQSVPSSTSTRTPAPLETMPTISVPTPTSTAVATRAPGTNEAVLECGLGQVGQDLNHMTPVHILLANPDSLFQACELADILDAPTKGGGPLQILKAAPDVLGRLTFIFEDGVCWDRLLHVTQSPANTPIPAPSFISGMPPLPASHWFDLSVETVYTDENPCPAIGVSRSVRLQLAGWPEIPIETSNATPQGAGPGST